jgi:uncharacterized phage protein (TIGR02218 family)
MSLTLTSDHVALLATRKFWSVDLYQIDLQEGTTLRFADGGMDVSALGFTWSGSGPLISRSSLRLTAGLDADDLTVVVRPKTSDLLYGLPWRNAAANGAFDGASLTLYRAHAATPGGAIVGALMRFSGPINDWEVGIDISIKVKSITYYLNRLWPRAVFQSGCDRTLFDAGCGIARSAHQLSGSLLASSTRQILQTPIAAADGIYNGGEIRFITGLNAGAHRTVKSQVGGVISLAYPLVREPAAGDAYVIWPGCDGTRAACTRFGNTVRYRGEDFVPSPETSY